MHLILVHIGPEFPEYINDCISQANKFINIPIHVLISKEHINRVSNIAIRYPIEYLGSSYITEFDSNSKLDFSFRNGFWKYATMRFFYIHAYALKTNIEDIFHIEYDNLIYYDIARKIDVFRQMNMWLVMDAENRCIPSFMYFKNHQAIEPLLPHMIRTSKENMNDMHSLAEYYRNNKETTGALPIVINYPDTVDPMFYQNAFKFGCLFDGACVGQYIGGIDSRNQSGDTIGFINETAVIKCNKCNIEWKVVDDLKRPFLNDLPVINLHVHSKDLKRWSSYFSFNMDIISGERIQNICDVYCGLKEDFDYNPIISFQKSKHLDISQLSAPFNNPLFVFCYPHRLTLLGSKIDLFQNQFILVTHNSDENITPRYLYIIENPKIIKIYSQNIGFEHPKLVFLPIGIANKMWPHGNSDSLLLTMHNKIPKTKDVYFYFDVNTNYSKRSECKSILESKGLVFGSPIPNNEYLRSLAQYKFSICPEGNGMDSHRIWESIYLNVIPIMLKTSFTILLKRSYPCILLDSWQDFDMPSILASYNDMNTMLQCVKNTLNLSYYDHLIRFGTSFDIVIPLGPNEYEKLPIQIEYTKRHVIGYRYIYIVTNTSKIPEKVPGCIYIDESIFPFSLKDIAEYHGESSRNGWYLQQIIKLYASMVIPGILENYLVLDADTYFLRPISFLDKGAILFNVGTENHAPYFSHMSRLHPSLTRTRPDLSGVCHHMLMSKMFIRSLFEMVESHHGGIPFWRVFLKEVDKDFYIHSGASEYEIYFNYMLSFHPRFIRIRPLKWMNCPSFPRIKDELDYVSCHWYMT